MTIAAIIGAVAALLTASTALVRVIKGRKSPPPPRAYVYCPATQRACTDRTCRGSVCNLLER